MTVETKPTRVLGIGVDIIEVDRISKDLAKPFFASRFCTQDEIDDCDSMSGETRTLWYARCFSVKEAVYKALDGAGQGLSWKEAILRRNEDSQPSVELTGRAKQLADELGISSLSVTFTEIRDVPIVICIARGQYPPVS